MHGPPIPLPVPAYYPHWAQLYVFGAVLVSATTVYVARLIIPIINPIKAIAKELSTWAHAMPKLVQMEKEFQPDVGSLRSKVDQIVVAYGEQHKAQTIQSARTEELAGILARNVDRIVAIITVMVQQEVGSSTRQLQDRLETISQVTREELAEFRHHNLLLNQTEIAILADHSAKLDAAPLLPADQRAIVPKAAPGEKDSAVESRGTAGMVIVEEMEGL